MPLYMCNAARTVIPEAAKPKIAADITQIHCQITGAARGGVHVFFFQDAPQVPIHGKQVFVFGTLPSGSTQAQKAQLVQCIEASVCARTGVAICDVMVDTVDAPASWILQGAHTAPEPDQGDQRPGAAAARFR